MKLPQIIYRDLLVVARALDSSVAFRALVSSNLLERPVVGDAKTRLPYVEAFNRDLLHFLQNRSYYLPSRDRPSVESIVRERFRSNGNDSKLAIDTAFVALKALNDRMAYAVDAGIIDARDVGAGVYKPTATPTTLRSRVRATRSKLVKELTIAQALREKAIEKPPLTLSVRLVENVTTGVFLLAHPMLNGIFSRAVIVLTDHSTTKGTKGFIVNRPTKVRLMKRFKVHPRILRAFGASKVRKGGPLRTEFAEILHSQTELGGDRVIASNFKTTMDDDLFAGIDLDAAAKAVEAGTIQPTDVVFINGMSSWSPGQLDGEMQRGTWIAVRAPLSVAVSTQKTLWADMMGRLGGEYEAFSRMPTVDDGDDFDDDEEEEEEEEEAIVGDDEDSGDEDEDDNASPSTGGGGVKEPRVK